MAGTMAGTIIDMRNNQPIEGANVATKPGGETTTSGADGSYSLSLAAGSYEVDITKSGYDPFIAAGIVVLDDVTTTINAGLMYVD